MQCSSHHITSIVSVVVLRVFNRFRVIRENTLKRLMFHRPKGKGLLTVSNHQSVVDDPGLWGALLPFWRISPEQMRWSLCTDDIFYVCVSLYYRWSTSELIFMLLRCLSIESLADPFLGVRQWPSVGPIRLSRSTHATAIPREIEARVVVPSVLRGQGRTELEVLRSWPTRAGALQAWCGEDHRSQLS